VTAAELGAQISARMLAQQRPPEPPDIDEPPDVDEPPPDSGDSRDSRDSRDGGDTPPRMRDRLLTLDDLGKLPPAEPLIDGLLYRGTLAQLSGPPGSHKTFIALAKACSVAASVPLVDRYPVPIGGPVVYVAEAPQGLHARIHAWCQHYAVDPDDVRRNLRVLPAPLLLRRPSEVAEMADILRDMGAVLLTLDTRARCTAGLEENSATEQQRAIDVLDVLIADTGAAVEVVHHSGRVGTAPRGSTAWDGAVWSDLRVTGNASSIDCHKHKDVPDGCEHVFRMERVTVDEAAMPGVPTPLRSTLVTVDGEGASGLVDHKTGRIVRQVVRRCADSEGLTKPVIRDLAIAQGGGRTQVYEALKALVTDGVLINVARGKRPRYRLADGQENLD
jgi:hypothetical protein